MYSYKPLKLIESNTSTIIHSIKESDEEFSSFGELYFSKLKKIKSEDGNFIRK